MNRKEEEENSEFRKKVANDEHWQGNISKNLDIGIRIEKDTNLLIKSYLVFLRERSLSN